MDFEDIPRFEPMTTGRLLDRAFRLYGANFSLMLGITAVAYVPLYALKLLMQAAASNTSSALGRAFFTNFSEILFFILWVSVAFPFATGAATYAISERYLGNEVTIDQALWRALRKFWTLSMAQLIVGIRVALGLILLIIPGILWSLSYALVVPAILVENQKPAPSLKRSSELVKGYRGKVFLVVAVVLVLQWVLGFGAGSLSVMFRESGSATRNLMVAIFTDFTEILFTPLGIIANILLYYDFRIRKEGFDLEMLSRALAVRPETAASVSIQP